MKSLNREIRSLPFESIGDEPTTLLGRFQPGNTRIHTVGRTRNQSQYLFEVENDSRFLHPYLRSEIVDLHREGSEHVMPLRRSQRRSGSSHHPQTCDSMRRLDRPPRKCRSRHAATFGKRGSPPGRNSDGRGANPPAKATFGVRAVRPVSGLGPHRDLQGRRVCRPTTSRPAFVASTVPAGEGSTL